MPFGRRKKEPIASIIKNTLIYLISFSRTRKLISVSLKRLKGSPYDLAIGLSSGIAISFTPFIGLHALIAFSTSGERGQTKYILREQEHTPVLPSPFMINTLPPPPMVTSKTYDWV